MQRTRRAILILVLWLAALFAGPVLSASARSCAPVSAAESVTAAVRCPMQKKAGNAPCCCCPSESKQAIPAESKATGCACSLEQGAPILPTEATAAPLPGFPVALFAVPAIAVIPPLAHLAADAPLPPFAARLQLPQRAPDTGRAPPAT